MATVKLLNQWLTSNSRATNTRVSPFPLPFKICSTNLHLKTCMNEHTNTHTHTLHITQTFKIKELSKNGLHISGLKG